LSECELPKTESAGTVVRAITNGICFWEVGRKDGGTTVWRIVSIGPGPGEVPRRVTDRGPLLDNEPRAIAIAAWLRATGLYEIVTVERVGTVIEHRSVRVGD
jgi:hypothetical protein